MTLSNGDKIMLGKNQRRVLQDMQSAGLVIRMICDYRREAQTYCVLEDEDNINTYEKLQNNFVQRLFDRGYLTMEDETRSLDIYVYTFRLKPELKQALCVHDYGDSNYGFQTCKKCNYTF